MSGSEKPKDQGGELLPCGWCHELPTSRSGCAWCGNIQCPMYLHDMTIPNWNRRAKPEGAVRGEVLKQRLEDYANGNGATFLVFTKGPETDTQTVEVRPVEGE